ncbi:MAG: bifunctional demethylmenaquinone methyltransferase/2-methoxy-6-polyprenyl-1,4-benzoquinol methylase UbiE [Deltaproteobacteria bacterium]|nr:bifunctional demethylmenaquinone methyltransferase/2-methoxy-6-polyprenyl-1,4-benzoquinol methylase UbiE [Deltaproteobacteria bacterium]
MSYKHPVPEQKARYVQDKFDEIAANYDSFNDLITQGQHRKWKNLMVDRLPLEGKRTGLDLCCGTGDIALRILRRLDKDSRIIGADFSNRMLNIARHRLSRARKNPHALEPVLINTDAMSLPFGEGTFDFITIGYGLRNVSDLKKCLEELYRVMAPGGVLVTLDTGQVRPRLLRSMADYYMFRIVPRIGRMLQPGQEMYSYLPHSTLDYPHQDELGRMFSEAGFVDIELKEFLFGASVIHLARKSA